MNVMWCRATFHPNEKKRTEIHHYRVVWISLWRRWTILLRSNFTIVRWSSSSILNVESFVFLFIFFPFFRETFRPFYEICDIRNLSTVFPSSGECRGTQSMHSSCHRASNIWLPLTSHRIHSTSTISHLSSLSIAMASILLFHFITPRLLVMSLGLPVRRICEN